MAKLYGKDRTIMAFAIAVSSDRPLNEEDPGLFEGVCKKLNEEICKVDRHRQHGQRMLELHLSKLIEADIRADRYVASYIEIIYNGLKDYLYLAVADISQCDPTYAALDSYKELFKQIRPGFKYATYRNHILIVMSTDESDFNPRKSFNRLNRLLKQENIKVGISSRFENLFDLSRHYLEAVSALHEGLKAGDGQYIFGYGNCRSSE